MAADRPLTTTQAAKILHCSRQHIVTLCDEGTLPYSLVGTHRRISPDDLKRVIQPALTCDEEQALWLHHAVAAKLVLDPDGVIAHAAQRIDTASDASDAVVHRRWELLLEMGPA